MRPFSVIYGKAIKYSKYLIALFTVYVSKITASRRIAFNTILAVLKIR